MSDEESVQKLKEAGLEFGPCDPLPEEGQVIILGEEPDPARRIRQPCNAPSLEAARQPTS
ncbi:hypothetical protein GCM10023146_01660 [Nocardioides caricicola]